MNQDNTLLYAVGAGVFFVFVLWHKGYLQPIFQAVFPEGGGSADPPAAPLSGESQRLFRLATRAAILEAQDAAADKIAEKVREGVISNLSASFFLDNPPAGEPPASGS